MRWERGRAWRRLAGAALVAVLVVAGCGGDDEATPQDAQAASGCEQVEAPPPRKVDLKRPTEPVRRGQKLTAAVQTSCGTFEIALDTRRSPKTAASFVHLAEEGAYDETTIHRVVPDFIVQGGDASGVAGEGPGYFVDEPPPPSTTYRRGVVAMAKSPAEPPGRSGSEFFVVAAPADAGLPPAYAVLGEVVEGQDVVQRIAALADPELGPEGGLPLQPVVIEQVDVKRRS